MKWEDRPRSDNVEIDCLGLRSKFDDSPEAQAALACQAELGNIRADLVDRIVGGNNTTSGIAELDNPRRLVAEQHVERAMVKDIASFVNLLGDDSNKGIARKWFENMMGLKTYEGRVGMFKGYLEVPPLELSPGASHAGTAGGESPIDGTRPR